MPGHRESRKDMMDSYENFEKQERRMRSEPRQYPNSGVRASRLTAALAYAGAAAPAAPGELRTDSPASGSDLQSEAGHTSNRG